MWHDYARSLLIKEMEEIRLRNPSYSLRAMAKRLDLSPGALSEIINGRRKISKRVATIFLQNLPLESAEKEKLRSYLENDIKGIRKTLRPDIFEVIQDWRYFSFLAAGELSSPPRTSQGFAEAFEMPPQEAEKILEDLVKLGFLHKEAGGIYRHTGEHLMTTDEIPSEAIRKSHLSSIEKSKVALDLPLPERDFISLTFPGTSERMPRAKKEIRQFSNRLCSLMAGSKRDRVYRVAVQFYPVTVKRKKT